jgi:hypothetical protein
VADLATAKDQLVDLANTFIKGEVKLVQESNPHNVLSLFTQKLKNNRKPRDFVVNARAYLSLLQQDPTFNQGVDAQTITDLKDRLDRTMCRIEPNAACPAPGTVPPPAVAPQTALAAREQAQSVVDDLYIDLIPANDLFFIANTIYDLVRKDLDRRIDHGEIDQSLALVLQLSNSDSLGEIVQSSIGRDPAATQAQNARGQAKENLSIIADLFGRQLVGSIEDAGLPEIQAKTCVRATLIPGAPVIGGKDISKWCRGKIWKSVQKGESLELRFDALVAKPFEQRVCSVYDFYRKSRLLELGR